MRSPVSPDQPTALALSSTFGCPLAAIASATAVVPSTRLRRITSLYDAVQRFSATPAPARWTTALTSSSSAGSSRRAEGSQVRSSGAFAAPRTNRTTSWPSPCRCGASADPISPDAPVTATLKQCLQAELGGEVAFLEAFLHRHQEAGGVGAVDDAVVVRQREVDHRADRDDLAELRVLDDDRALHHAAGAEDADLRLVDDRRVEQRAARSRV